MTSSHPVQSNDPYLGAGTGHNVGINNPANQAHVQNSSQAPDHDGIDGGWPQDVHHNQLMNGDDSFLTQNESAGGELQQPFGYTWADGTPFESSQAQPHGIPVPVIAVVPGLNAPSAPAALQLTGSNDSSTGVTPSLTSAPAFDPASASPHQSRSQPTSNTRRTKTIGNRPSPETQIPAGTTIQDIC